jgi:hypothetical protein
MGPIELIVIVLVLVPTIMAIADLVQRPPEQFPRYAKAGKSDKTGWIIALVVGWWIALGWLVAIVYLIVVRKKMGPVVKDVSGPPADAAPPVAPQN